MRILLLVVTLTLAGFLWALAVVAWKVLAAALCVTQIDSSWVMLYGWIVGSLASHLSGFNAWTEDENDHP